MSNIVPMPPRRQPPVPNPLRVTEYSLNVIDEVYHVRRTVDSETGRGFLMISDNTGPILLRDAQVPDVYITDIVLAWREGRKAENKKARAAADRMLREIVSSHRSGEIE